MKGKVQLTESKLIELIESEVRKFLKEDQYSDFQDQVKRVQGKSAELDDRLANNTDESLYGICDQIGQAAKEVERRFREAKAYKKEAAKEMNQAIEPMRNKPVIIYVKKRGVNGEAEGGFIKFPASIEKVDWFGENIYIHFQPLASWNDVIIEVMSSEKYDFSTLKIIPISDEEGASYRNTSPWGYFSERG